MELRGMRMPKGLRSLLAYRRENLISDAAAGILVAALALPQALGYAAVAKVPVQVGLYTLPPALLAYALFGSSRLLYMGPISTVSVLSGSAVSQLSGGDTERAVQYTAALSIAAGLMLVLAGVLRVGWVAAFLSEPIVTGFVTGLVVLIVVGEVPALLGLPRPSGGIFGRIWFLLNNLQQSLPLIAAISAIALLLLFGGSRIAPRLPWSLIVLTLGIVASQLLDLAGRGAPVVGEVPAGLPAPSLPAIPPGDWGPLLIAGAGIAAIGLAEGLAAARTFRQPDEALRDDDEMIANGAADLATGLFGGMGVGGSLSKTAANARAGARTQMAGVIGAVAVLIVLVFATGLLAPLPKAVLSAIVVHAVWGLVKPSAFRRYSQVRRNDFVSSMVAFGGVLVLGPLNGLLLAVIQSLLGLVYRFTTISVYEVGKVPGEKAAWGSLIHDETRRRIPHLMLIRLDGPLFWANADPVFTQIHAMLADRPDAVAVVIDLQATNQMDTTTADRMLEFVEAMRAEGREVYLVRLFEGVRNVLRSAGVLDKLGRKRVWRSMSAAVKAARKSEAVQAAHTARKAAAADHDRDHLDDAELDAQLGPEEPTDEDSYDDPGEEGTDQLVLEAATDDVDITDRFRPRKLPPA